MKFIKADKYNRILLPLLMFISIVSLSIAQSTITAKKPVDCGSKQSVFEVSGNWLSIVTYCYQYEIFIYDASGDLYTRKEYSVQDSNCKRLQRFFLPEGKYKVLVSKKGQSPHDDDYNTFEILPALPFRVGVKRV